MVSSLRFLYSYYTRGRAPLNEWLARRKGLYRHRTSQLIQKKNIHAPSGIRTRDPSNQAATARYRDRLAVHCLGSNRTWIGQSLMQEWAHIYAANYAHLVIALDFYTVDKAAEAWICPLILFTVEINTQNFTSTLPIIHYILMDNLGDTFTVPLLFQLNSLDIICVLSQRLWPTKCINCVSSIRSHFDIRTVKLIQSDELVRLYSTHAVIKNLYVSV
jgi:hypothetical protein